MCSSPPLEHKIRIKLIFKTNLKIKKKIYQIQTRFFHSAFNLNITLVILIFLNVMNHVRFTPTLNLKKQNKIRLTQLYTVLNLQNCSEVGQIFLNYAKYSIC